MTIVEKNEVIARYMGLKPSPKKIQDFVIDLGKFGKYYEKEPGIHIFLEYHRSWDWLMPVVNKLEKEGHPVHISSNNCSIYWSTKTIENNEFMVDQYGENKLDAVYNAVYFFIKYKLKNKENE